MITHPILLRDMKNEYVRMLEEHGSPIDARMLSEHRINMLRESITLIDALIDRFPYGFDTDTMTTGELA